VYIHFCLFMGRDYFRGCGGLHGVSVWKFWRSFFFFFFSFFIFSEFCFHFMICTGGWVVYVICHKGFVGYLAPFLFFRWIFFYWKILSTHIFYFLFYLEHSNISSHIFFSFLLFLFYFFYFFILI
jgi:hypothetical protein